MPTQFAAFGSTQLDPRVVGDQAAPDAPDASAEGEVSKGLRSGGLGLRSGFNAFLASGARAAGADGFAADRQAAAEQDAQDAAAADASLRVRSYKDVHSLRDALDYGKGQIGELLPSVGGGVAAAGLGGLVAGPAGAFAAGTAAFTPVEAGDIAMRQQADPVARQRPAGENFLRALGGGALSSAGQNLVPAVMGGKLIGQTAERAAAQTLGRSVATNLAEGVAGQGVAGAGAEALKQKVVNENAPLNTDAITEAGLANAAVGLPLAGVGVVGDTFHGAPRAALAGAANMARDGFDAARSKVGAGIDAATTAAQNNTPEAVKRWGDAIGAYASDAASSFTGSIGERAQATRAALGEILNADDVPAEIKARAKAAMTNVGDVANQQWAAAAAKARSAFQTADTAPGAAPDATPAVQPPLDGIREAAAPKDDAADRILSGKPLGDLQRLATAQGDDLMKAFNESTAAAQQKVGEWGTALMGRADVSPETRAKLQQALQDTGDTANQVFVAATQKAMQWKDAAVSTAGKLIDSLQKPAEGAADGAKKSEDYSGIRAAIAEHLAPLMPDEVRNDPKALASVAEATRGVIRAASNGDFATLQRHADDITRMLGPDAETALAKVYEATQQTENPKTTERFFTTLNQLRESNVRRTSVRDLVAKSLPAGSTIDPDAMTTHLLNWARGDGQAGMSGAQAQFYHGAVRAEIEKHFGDKAPALLKALEREANQTDVRTQQFDKQDMAYDPEQGAATDPRSQIDAEIARPDRPGQASDALQEGSLDTQYFGGGANSGGDKAGKLVPLQHPNLHDPSFGTESAAWKKIRELKAKYPAHDVSFITEAEYNKLHGLEGGSHDRGFVQVQGQDNTPVSPASLARMRLDTQRYPKSASRLEVELDGKPHILDAMAVTREFTKHIDGEGLPSPVRNARAFMDGISALTERAGKNVEVPDETVVARGMTYGEAKKLITPERTALDKEVDADRSRLNDLRKQYAQHAWPDEKLSASGLERKPLGAEKLAALHEEASDISGRLAAHRDGELGATYDKNETSRAQDVLEGYTPGAQNGSKDAQIHVASATLGDKPAIFATGKPKSGQELMTDRRETGPASTLQAKANLDGSPKAINEKAVANAKPLQLLAAHLGEQGAIGRKVGDRLSTLARNVAMLSRKDSAELQRLGGDMEASDVAEVINPIARKYKDQIVPPKVQPPAEPARVETQEAPPSPKAVAAKKAALTEKALSGDPELTQALRTSDDAKGLQRAVMHLSAHKFDEFDPSQSKGGIWGKGAYFTSNEKIVDKYRQLLDNPENKYHAQLELKDGEILDTTKTIGEQHPDILAALGRVMPKGFLEEHAGDNAEQLAVTLRQNWKDQFAKGMMDLGIKALHHQEAILWGQGKRVDGSWVVFDPKAIKIMQRLGRDEALNAANERLDTLVQNPDTAYALATKKYSAGPTGPGAGPSPETREAVGKYVESVLGKSVDVQLANISHAGEYRPGDIDRKAAIRIGVTALDPLGVAHHEATHALFDQLRKAGATDVTQVLERNAGSAHVREQLEKIWADNPEVLKQLDDPEERAAYAYQAWSADPQGFKIVPATRNVFRRVADYVRSVLGIWSNDDRALHILNYFNEGEYARKINDQRGIHEDLMKPGRNGAVDALKSMAEPVLKMGDAVFATGSGRLRDMDNEHINKIADLIKPEVTAKSKDVGFIAASRLERATRMNRLSDQLRGTTPEQMRAALESLQTGTPATDSKARAAALTVKRVLRDAHDYLTAADAKIGDRGPDYFPRVWDTNYISQHQEQFKAMLQKYVRSGDLVGDPDKILNRLIANDGNDFDVSRQGPGMQASKERVLDFITGDDAAQFLDKDLLRTVNGYLTQATRRAEWARRFGNDNSGLNKLLTDARLSGATNEHIETTEKYLQGVTGTLGDGLNPTARRMMGNMIVYQNLRLLPLAIFSSAVDPLGIVVRGGTMGDAFTAFKRGISELPKNFKKEGGKTDWQTSMAETLGVIDNAALTHSLGALYSQGMVSDLGRKINDTFFRYNLMEQFNTSMRVSAMEASLKFLEKHAAGENQHSERYLAELGLKASDVKLHNGRVALTTADGLSDAHALKMRQAVNQWVDGAVLRPDAADKPIYMNDPHYALVSHLKQFTYAFHKTIIERVLHEAKLGNYTPALTMLAYVPVMIAADYLKGFIQGGGEQPSWKANWGPADYVWNGAQRGGLLGVGQIGADIATNIHEGGSGIGALAGPTLDQFGEALKTAGGSERFGTLALHAMPANALYASAFKGGGHADPMFAD